MKPTAVFLIFALILSSCGPQYQVQWEPYTPEVMEEALKSGRPVLAYFYAAWCPPCYKLKDHTFSDPRVIEALEPYRRIKIDMSYKHSPKTEKLSRDYLIRGLPTMLFFDPSGRPVPNAGISGFIPADRFLARIPRYEVTESVPTEMSPP